MDFVRLELVLTFVLQGLIDVAGYHSDSLQLGGVEPYTRFSHGRESSIYRLEKVPKAGCIVNLKTDRTLHEDGKVRGGYRLEVEEVGKISPRLLPHYTDSYVEDEPCYLVKSAGIFAGHPKSLPFWSQFFNDWVVSQWYSFESDSIRCPSITDRPVTSKEFVALCEVMFAAIEHNSLSNWQIENILLPFCETVKLDANAMSKIDKLVACRGL